MPSKINASIVKLNKQKSIPAFVTDIVGDRCTVVLSGRGKTLRGLTYIGPAPQVGKAVHVNYISGKPIVETSGVSVAEATAISSSAAVLAKRPSIPEAPPPATTNHNDLGGLEGGLEPTDSDPGEYYHLSAEQYATLGSSGPSGPGLADHDHSGDAGDGGQFDAANLESGAASDGDVLTADGAGGAAWEAPSDGAGGGHIIQEGGTPLAAEPVLNFTGDVVVTDNPGVGTDVFISASNNLVIDQSGGTSDTYGVLAGDLDGENTDFTVSQEAYVTRTLSVYLNGQLLTQGSDEDWVELDPSSGTFRMNFPPNATDQLTTVSGFLGVINGPKGDQGIQGIQGIQGVQGEPGTPAVNSVHHQQFMWIIDGAYLTSAEVGVSPLRYYMAYVGAGATIEEIKIHLGTAPAVTPVRFRILKNGSTIFTGTDYVELGTGVTDANRTTDFASSGAATKDDYFQLELVQGDGSAANASIQMRYKWTLTGS